MRPYCTFLLFLATCFHFSLQVEAQTPAFIGQQLEDYIATGMKDWEVPGLAIVIVKDGKVVLRKGYGFANIATQQPIDENSLFFIASNTKLFTATALAHAQFRKKLSLNNKVTQYLPWYKLFDSLQTAQVTIRDLLSHRIGTATFQGDFTFWNTRLSSRQIMEKMRLLPPSLQFRQDFGYCNSCYLTAGSIVQAATGIPWAKYVEDSIVKPLQMTNTYVTSNAIRTNHANMAVPYTNTFTSNLQPVPDDQWDNLGPAASIVSNVKDLTQWLIMQLDSGRLQGKRILPWSVIQQTRDIQLMLSSRKSTVFPTHFQGYGLGVFVTDYMGRQVYAHTGGAAGMVSNVCFVPEEQLGIAILTNNDNQNFFEALRYQILDAYLGVPFTNRSKLFLTGFQEDRKIQLDSIANWQKIAGNALPALAISAYVGKYKHPLYGSIWINSTKDNKLVVRFEQHPTLEATLQTLDNNDWLITYNNPEFGFFRIPIRIEQGKVKSITIKSNDFIEYGTYEFLKE